MVVGFFIFGYKFDKIECTEKHELCFGLVNHFEYFQFNQISTFRASTEPLTVATLPNYLNKVQSSDLLSNSKSLASPLNTIGDLLADLL